MTHNTPAPETSGDAIRKAAPVKERLVQRQESNLLTLGVTNRGALSHRPIYSSAWNLSTSLTNQATSPSQSDTPPAICQQNRENLTYGAGRVNYRPVAA